MKSRFSTKCFTCSGKGLLESTFYSVAINSYKTVFPDQYLICYQCDGQGSMSWKLSNEAQTASIAL